MSTIWKQAFVQTANVRETVPFTLLSGCAGFLNALLLPSHAGMAFWVGGLIGALLFLRCWKIERVRGVAYLLAISLFSYALQASGTLDAFIAGVFG